MDEKEMRERAAELIRRHHDYLKVDPVGWAKARGIRPPEGVEQSEVIQMKMLCDYLVVPMGFGYRISEKDGEVSVSIEGKENPERRKEVRQEFIEEYMRLCDKYGLVVGFCPVCSGPKIFTAEQLMRALYMWELTGLDHRRCGS